MSEFLWKGRQIEDFEKNELIQIIAFLGGVIGNCKITMEDQKKEIDVLTRYSRN